MFEFELIEVNYYMLFGVPVALTLVVLLRDAVTKIMTFVKGLNLN